MFTIYNIAIANIAFHSVSLDIGSNARNFWYWPSRLTRDKARLCIARMVTWILKWCPWRSACEALAKMISAKSGKRRWFRGVREQSTTGSNFCQDWISKNLRSGWNMLKLVKHDACRFVWRWWINYMCDRNLNGCKCQKQTFKIRYETKSSCSRIPNRQNLRGQNPNLINEHIDL